MLASDGLRVALVARDPLVANFIAHPLQALGLEVVVASPTSLEELADVDAVVWDLGPQGSETELELPEDLPSLALADGLEEGARAVRAGAVGVVDRARPPEALAAALQAVVAGLFVAEPGLAQVDSGAPVQMDSPLSVREQEVLEALAEGLSNREIGAQLYVSEHTVRFHVRAILEKLGATSRTQAVVLGARAGLLEF